MAVTDYWINIASTEIPEYPEWCDALVYCHSQNVLIHSTGLIPVFFEMYNVPYPMVRKDLVYILIFIALYMSMLIPLALTGNVLYAALDFKSVISFVYLFLAVFLHLLAFFFVLCTSKRTVKKLKLSK